jgi:hypothetical protein
VRCQSAQSHVSGVCGKESLASVKATALESGLSHLRAGLSHSGQGSVLNAT